MFNVNIFPGYTGILFKNNVFNKILEPGVYKLYGGIFYDYKVMHVPMLSQVETVTNQEVLSKDNLSFRFSYYISYKVVDIKLMLENFQMFRDPEYFNKSSLVSVKEFIHLESQMIYRNNINLFELNEIHTKRDSLFVVKFQEFKDLLLEKGILLEKICIRDIILPKSVQELYLHQYETLQKAKSELEISRATVASFRALKNASQLVKDNPDIKFVKYLETLEIIAKKGNNTFVLSQNELAKI